MKKGSTDLDKIIAHMDEAMWMLKNNNDPNASANEKMDVETAKAMAGLGKVAVEGYKVKAQALGIMSKADNPATTKQLLLESGIANDESK
ncbi:hypothetical protein EZS27_006069 [termite gut metagenome]|jgi:hypothetical protein|uniref:Uncharacterized protein n=1 Tax=termite gut metagenome TaxID=433724 RepID=A0A5J4SJW2_9ZZZZ